MAIAWQRVATPVAAQQAAQLPDQPPPPVLDVQRASALERQANTEPNNAPVRVELGNLYFDAERFDIAASWYEAALKLEPGDKEALFPWFRGGSLRGKAVSQGPLDD